MTSTSDMALIDRCLSHMGRADFQKVLSDCHAVAGLAKEQAARIEALSKVEGELECAQFALRNGKSLAEDSIHAIREMLNAYNVPKAAFIDDHVGNAIAQRDELRAQIDAMGRRKPAAWLHTMHMECGQTRVEVTLDHQHPWGRAGKDYDETYDVVSEPLRRDGPLSAFQKGEPTDE